MAEAKSSLVVGMGFSSSATQKAYSSRHNTGPIEGHRSTLSVANFAEILGVFHVSSRRLQLCRETTASLSGRCTPLS